MWQIGVFGEDRGDLIPSCVSVIRAASVGLYVMKYFFGILVWYEVVVAAEITTIWHFTRTTTECYVSSDILTQFEVHRLVLCQSDQRRHLSIMDVVCVLVFI